MYSLWIRGTHFYLCISCNFVYVTFHYLVRNLSKLDEVSFNRAEIVMLLGRRGAWLNSLRYYPHDMFSYMIYYKIYAYEVSIDSSLKEISIILPLRGSPLVCFYEGLHRFGPLEVSMWFGPMGFSNALLWEVTTWFGTMGGLNWLALSEDTSVLPLRGSLFNLPVQESPLACPFGGPYATCLYRESQLACPLGVSLLLQRSPKICSCCGSPSICP